MDLQVSELGPHNHGLQARALPPHFKMARAYGPMLAGVHVLRCKSALVTAAGGEGGVAHGVLTKSKKSKRFGCAASRAVRCAEGPMKRFSTNFMMAVWSIGICET